MAAPPMALSRSPRPPAPRGTRIAAALVVISAAAAALGWLVAGHGDEHGRAAAATATPTTPRPVAVPGFTTVACQRTPLAAGSVLGLGIPRAARLQAGGAERTVLDAAARCLRAVAGQPPTLRTQVPIDAARRTAPEDDERGQLAAFAALLDQYGSPGILSIRAHDFTRCGRDGAPPARQVAELPEGQPLASCEFPTPALYGRLLGELRALVAQLAPSAQLQWTAWNEPDHPMFTLLDRLGGLGAARRAGQYWAQAAAQLGAANVLAGEFSDRDPATLLHLRDAFVAGAGQTPPAWALHPYRDLTQGVSGGPSVDEQFAAAVAPAPVWLTEVTARLSGRGGLGGDPTDQLARGIWLRDELGRRPVRAILYLLTPPDAPRVAAGDTWDSAIADRQGRARPFICGLAGLPPQDCPGSPATYGG